jgi:hypothetical protein
MLSNIIQDVNREALVYLSAISSWAVSSRLDASVEHRVIFTQIYQPDASAGKPS